MFLLFILSIFIISFYKVFFFLSWSLVWLFGLTTRRYKTVLETLSPNVLEKCQVFDIFCVVISGSSELQGQPRALFLCCMYTTSRSSSLDSKTELTENCPCTGRDLSNVDSDPKDHFLSNMSWLFFVNEKSYQLCIFRGCLPFRHNICYLVE